MERRDLLKVAGTGIAGMFAGSYLVAGIPRVKVTDFQGAEQLIGPSEIGVLLTNEGGSGEVDVEIAVMDNRGVVLDRFTKTIEMGASTQRQETFEAEVPDGTEQLVVEAHASILPDFLRFG